MGIGFIWPVIMATGMLFLPESPRWDYRKGHIERAGRTVASVHGVSENHFVVKRELREIREKLEEETAGNPKKKFFEIFTGPRMFYRVALGIVLQALQQLTGKFDVSDRVLKY
jgi:SP family sugar:H+ symporter-like MFS transporter